MNLRKLFAKKDKVISQNNSQELKETGLSISTGTIKDTILRQQINYSNKISIGTEKLADEIIRKKAADLTKRGKVIDKDSLIAGYSEGLRMIGLSKEYLEQRIDLYLNPPPVKETNPEPEEKNGK